MVILEQYYDPVYNITVTVRDKPKQIRKKKAVETKKKTKKKSKPKAKQTSSMFDW